MKTQRRELKLIQVAGSIALTVLLVLNTVISSAALSEAVMVSSLKVNRIMRSLTLEEKVAQMILASAPSSSLRNQQKTYPFGGYLFFADYFQKNTKTGVKKEIAAWQKASTVDLLIAVDEEGGTVTRVSKYKQFREKRYASPRSVYLSGGWAGIVSDTKEKARFLKSLGINTNLAPVVDVPSRSSDYMYSRAISMDPKTVSEFARKTVQIYNAQSVVSALKHFPGYGNNGNTHNAVIRDKRSKKTFKTRDLLPFQSGIEAGAPMIMVNHNIVECYDSGNPASLSGSVHKLLRNDLGFQGVIVTDDLAMQGVKNIAGSDAAIAVKAVKAGNDLLCTHSPVTGYRAILNAVKQGVVSERRIDESVRRILTMKNNMNLI